MIFTKRMKHKCAGCEERHKSHSNKCYSCLSTEYAIHKKGELKKIVGADAHPTPSTLAAYWHKEVEPEPASEFTDRMIAQMNDGVKRIVRREILDALKNKNCTIPELSKGLGEKERQIQECIGELEESGKVRISAMRPLGERGEFGHIAEYCLINTPKPRSSKTKSKNNKEQEKPNPILNRIREISL